MLGILIAGSFPGNLIGEEVHAYRLEDFGYNVLQAPSHLPVVLIIVNYAGQPPIAHDNHYYEDILRNRIALYFRAMSDGRVTIQHAGTINVSLSENDLGLPDKERLVGATSWVKATQQHEIDTNRPGSDIYYRSTDNVAQCIEICRGDTRCSAVTFYPWSNCYIKHGTLPGERPFGRMPQSQGKFHRFGPLKFHS